MGLIDEVGEGPAALDAVAFIYWIEENRDYLDLVASIFQAADDGDIEIVSSALTLLEVLVVPYRAGQLHLADRYEALLTRGRNVRLLDIDRAQLRAAAQLRAIHRLRTPDALQLAAALSTRCTVFVTNDRRLPELPGLQILQLRDYV
ncbi:MAG: type II toxin-antitoxin system VapC family toxin [Myxococcota bacterium]